MQSHINVLCDLAEQMAAIGAEIKDDELAITLLCSLPERFNSLVTSLESRPADEITFDFVSARLLSEFSRQEESRTVRLEVEEARALHTRQDSQNAQVGVVDKSRYMCTHCKRKGHLKVDCWDLHGRPRRESKEDIKSQSQSLAALDINSY